MSKKKVWRLLGICFFTICVCLFGTKHIIDIMKNKEKNVELERVSLNDNIKEISKDLFAIMVENEDGSGYDVADDFPDGLILNDTLSGCIDAKGKKVDNTLEYKNGIIMFDANSVSYCYLYFSKYEVLFENVEGEQSEIIPCSGYYKLEVWGAQGGSSGTKSGYGGYATGTIYLEKNTTLYINVGGKGTTAKSGTIPGGYNGGGNALAYQDGNNGSGGGATHIAKSSGLLSSLSSHVSDILIVAGGGGSGYIGNSNLTNKVMYCYGCTESSEENTKTISTTNVSETATSNYAKKGNGNAKITFIES